MASNKDNYVAVTIGPIFDTMSLVSTPAALWVSSYMFSYITKTICELLLDCGVKEEDIITPYFSKSAPDLLGKKDGVGLFHDRIIFVAKNFDIKSFKQIKEKTLEKVSEVFELDPGYLTDYVQIAAVEYEAQNPILGCNHILASRELEKPFVAEDTEQPLLKLLFAKEGAANERIKAIAKKLGVYEKWQLSTDDGIKDLDTIVKTKKDSDLKKHRYYAIVRSDGDNMSEIISSLNENENFRDFSKDCLTYCSNISDEVAKFGGVTIYAGGDDLLAILPCESEDGKTPFEFIEKANETFNTQFNSYNKPTSLSFGISMCHKKFPLYEALEDSAHLLFDIAKDKEYKNCSVVHLQKHSGQSEGLLIPNSALNEFLSLKKYAVSIDSSEEKKERIILSSLHKLSLFEHLLKAVDNDLESVLTLFKNIFDSGEQKTDFLHKKLPKFYQKLKTSAGILALTNEGIQSDPVTTIVYTLRVLKFFNEKAGG